MTNNFKKVSGDNGTVQYDSTAVPLALLQQLKRDTPLPITISGVNQVTFTLAASTTNKIPFWSGRNPFVLQRNLTYTWLTGATNAILSSAGVYTASQSNSAGIWYMYVGMDIDGDAGTVNDIILLPSQTAPSYAEGPLNAGILCHPGTTRTTVWNYVGWMLNTTATTPVFEAATKIGYRYNFALTNHTSATATTWAELALSLPAIGAVGGTAGGYITVGAAGTLTVGSTATEGVGSVIGDAPSASADHLMPLPPMPITANGKLYGNHDTAAGDVNITFVDDVV